MRVLQMNAPGYIGPVLDAVTPGPSLLAQSGELGLYYCPFAPGWTSARLPETTAYYYVVQCNIGLWTSNTKSSR